MQQQTNTNTSNLQVKLITDARKLLEKVRSQQLLSADSSFDSSFLFDQPVQDSKDAVIVKRDSADNNDTIEIIHCHDNNQQKQHQQQQQHQQQHKSSSSASLKMTIDALGGSDTSSSFNLESSSNKNMSSSPISRQQQQQQQQRSFITKSTVDFLDDSFLPTTTTIAATATAASATTTTDLPENIGVQILPTIPSQSNDENVMIGNGNVIFENKDMIHEYNQLQLLQQELHHQEQPQSQRSQENESNESSSVEKLQEENMKLKRENYHLNEEMNDFEYKLYCLEHTLGIIEDVEKSQKECNKYEYDDTRDDDVAKSTLMPIVASTNENGEDGGRDEPGRVAQDRLSPITAMVAEAVISSTGVVSSTMNLNSVTTSLGRDGPPLSPTKSIRKSKQQQAQEIKILRENNEKMVTAIKALAQATIAQTRKHYLYKKRHHMTKQMVVEENEKLNQLMAEKEKVQSEFYETRSNLLKEKDVREELSSEIQFLAKKNNVLRQERQMHEDMRMQILDRVEFRDDAASVLSRLSESSCFPILQTITESGTDGIGVGGSNSIGSSRRGSGGGSSSSSGRRRSQRLTKDKNVEKLIFKLISQLKKRDAKIEKLEKKLQITMQYLQGALELEVARQDAEIASQTKE